MRYEILEKARAERDRIERDHASTVHKANVAVRASRTKLDAAKKRVRNLEFAAMQAELAMQAERAQERR